MTEVPEKFAGMPLGTRAVQLPDGEVNHPFLKTFGQPARELACECEREGDSNLAQALQLINGPTVNDNLRNPNNRIGKLLAAKKSRQGDPRRAVPGDAVAPPERDRGEGDARPRQQRSPGAHVASAGGKGALIEAVTPDSPAFKAGLKVGDTIKKLDATAITGPEQFTPALAAKMPGTVISITVTRNGQDMDVKATLSDKRRAWEDVHWALINSKEFLFRH